ncbi:MAG: hypothetical protein WBF53_09160, partial [Litorimonas sp.]
MSETTPDSTTGATGGTTDFISAEAEPSMEDILASIRKIIADDADPVPLDGPSDMASVSVEQTVTTTVEVDTAAPDMAFKPEVVSEDTDLDLDALLTEIDVIEPATDLDAGEADLAIPEPEPEPQVDPQSEAPSSAPDTDSGDESDEMDRLMSELLMGLDEEMPPTEPIEVEASKADVTVAAAEIGDDAELDLVKSLMADLTDDDLASAVQTSDDLIEADADLAIPPEPVTDSAEDDILDSILNMTLEDEIAALEQQVEIESDAPASVPAPELASQPDDAPSLAEIAAAAEADA